MTEAGGPAAHSGIFFQNTIAARYLLELLELSPLPPRERVVELRLEAPAHVDDMVVRYADGHQEWIQAKVRISSSGETWAKLWRDLAAQLSSNQFGFEDRLLIVLGRADETALALRNLVDRAGSAVTSEELEQRLGKSELRVLLAVQGVVPSTVSTFELLRRVSVEIVSADDVERAYSRRRVAGAFLLPQTLFNVLRDIAGGASRGRALFMPAPLRVRLLNDFALRLDEPASWGVAEYRTMLAELAHMEIPGTAVSGPVDRYFVWPRACDLDMTLRADFEDERSPKRAGSSERIDLRNFPSHRLDRCVIVAGPGYGKTALIKAVARKLLDTPYLPVLIPLPAFASTELTLVEYLSEINREYSLRIDWARLAEQGLAVLLFDGLDEIPPSRRPTVLHRIHTFSARFRSAPWLLTARDASVLTGPAKARVLELMPLQADDVSRFVEVMRPDLDRTKAWEFTRRLDAHPDIAQLARIPLFLAMLLSHSAHEDPLPRARADLIESYLRTLFSPQDHKPSTPPVVAASVLREVTEALAFERLEAQEIGTTEREVLHTVQRICDEKITPDLVISQLIVQGLLRRQGAVRLQFPFPIVQEYLAACYLVRELPDTLPNRIKDALHRPWAQVLQFALEMHSAPSPIVRAVLDLRDDAFSTGLRLVGRCVANGARVDPPLKNEITSRLCTVWYRASWDLRTRVGRLIADAFSRPLIPELRSILGSRWLIESGAGEIVSRENDRELTREVLRTLLDEGLDRFMTLRSLQPALNELGDEALSMYCARAKNPDITADGTEGLANLVESLDSQRISRDNALEIALDHSLPDELKLAAFSLTRPDIDARAWPLVYKAVQSDYYGDRSAAQHVISSSPLASSHALSLLRDSNMPKGRREELAGALPRLIRDRAELIAFARNVVNDDAVPRRVQEILLAFLARYGERSAFIRLIAQIPTADLEIVGITIGLLGHYPSRELGLEALRFVEARDLTTAATAKLVGNVTIGMNYIFEMDGFGSGALVTSSPHPSTPEWAALLETWRDRADATLVQRLRLTLASLELGSDPAIVELERIVADAPHPDDEIWNEEDEDGHVLRRAADELTRKRRPISLDLARVFATCERSNVPYAGVQAAVAHGTPDALQLLVDLYNASDKSSLRGTILEAVEPLAGALNVQVFKEDRFLVFAAPST